MGRLLLWFSLHILCSTSGGVLGIYAVLTSPHSAGAARVYGYNATGNLTSRTDFRGKTTHYGYDLMNRLLSKTPEVSSQEPAVTFTYSATGHLLTMSDASGTTNYSYDAVSNRLTRTSTIAAVSSTTSRRGYQGVGSLIVLV